MEIDPSSRSPRRFSRLDASYVTLIPVLTRSPLAVMTTFPREGLVERSQETPWGVCVHTTGSGVPTAAQRSGRTPLEIATEIYLRPDAPPHFTPFPHYVIDATGYLLQIADEHIRARHVAISDAERALYKSGGWRSKVSPLGLSLWQDRWGATRNPLQLFPSRLPNEDFLGVELIPGLRAQTNGSRFTLAQYGRLSALLEDVENRYGLELTGSRLVGHEDLSPLTRWNSGGGWDPGLLRQPPTFLTDQLKRRDGSAFG